MKKWQSFLYGFLSFFILFLSLDLIRFIVDSGLYNEWFVGLAVLLILIIGWLGVFLCVKSYLRNKNQRSKTTETKTKLIKAYVLFVQVWSLLLTFDMMDYFLENNILNKWCFFCLGLMLLFLGWGNAQLDNILSKGQKKHK